MKSLCLVDEYPPYFRGRLGTYAAEMAPRLAALGADPTVISHNRGGDPARECAAERTVAVYRDAIERHRTAAGRAGAGTDTTITTAGP